MDGTWFGTAVSVLLLLLFQLAGLCAAWTFLPGESAGARLVLGSVCGSVMLQWFPVPFAFLLGFSPAAHLCAAAAALVCAGFCLYRMRKQKRGVSLSGLSGAFSAFKRCPFLWAVLGMTVFFGFLVWHSFLFKDDRIFSSQATYGDMSMHLSFITSLARQQKFPPDYSLLPGNRLSYPFLSDSISSSLYLCGASLKLAYFLPMLLAGAQVFFGFFLFAARLLNSRKRACLAWTLFFFNGGAGFLYFLGSWESFCGIFTNFYTTPTNHVTENIRWVNVVVDMMLPQRATLFGWAVLFPTLYLLYRAVYDGEKRYFLFAGIAAGLLPMIHTHSFLALALVCGGWLLFWLLRGLSLEQRGAQAGKALVCVGLPAMCLLYPVVRDAVDQSFLLWVTAGCAGAFLLLLFVLLWKYICKEGWRPVLSAWGVLLAAVCVLAFPQLFYWTFRQVGNGHFLRGHMGWAIGQGTDGYLVFYLKNLGVAAVLAFLGLLTAKGQSFSKLAPALLIWFLAETVEFQPNDYDNNKLLYVAFALLCCGAAEQAAGLLARVKKRGLRASLAGAGAVLCTLSAVLTMGREAVAQYELFGVGALRLCRWVEENVPPGAVILTDTRHNNEIASLTGRNIVCGSSVYLYYHGLPYEGRERAVETIYKDPAGAEVLLDRYGVDYILVSDFERHSYGIDGQEFAARYPAVFDDGNRALYRCGPESE